MHPDDLASRGLNDGQLVRVSSRVGQIEVEVLGSLDMMKGVVSLPHGWGHARPGVQMAIASSQPGSSANDLTDECQLDELSGNAALNGVPVKVAAALSGLQFKGFNGDSAVRKNDHQMQQGLWISKWQKVDAKNKYSVENTGYTFAPVKYLEAYVASTPTSCQMKRPG